MDLDYIRKRLRDSDLRVTPQRIAVLATLIESDKHPDADQIVSIVREQYSNIAVGTIYHILDNLVQKGIVTKVQTEQNVVRYDAVLEPHFHLFSEHENRIEDYMDDELMQMINTHLAKKKIKNFRIDKINVQLIGEFEK